MKTTVDNAVVEYIRVNNLTRPKTNGANNMPTDMTIDSVRADVGDQDIEYDYAASKL